MTDEPAPSTRAELLARWYDLDLEDDPGDLDLYLALASRTGGPILELAAGSGRIAVALAVAGHEVVAVDLDPAMVGRARAAWDRVLEGAQDRRVGRLELVTADLLEVELGPRFGLVVLALNSLLLLGTAERQGSALRAMARHLRPDGRAVVDVWLPAPDDLALYDGRLVLEWERADPATGGRVAKLAAARHDPATAAVEVTTIFDTWPAEGGAPVRVSRTDLLRLIGAAELRRLAEDAGLRIETLGGDHELTPFGPGAERAVLVAGLV